MVTISALQLPLLNRQVYLKKGITNQDGNFVQKLLVPSKTFLPKEESFSSTVLT